MHLGLIIKTMLISCLTVILLGPIVIPFLRRLKVGQSIREEGPKSHIATKSGTPTMGGILIIVGILMAVLTSGTFVDGSFIYKVSFFSTTYVGAESIIGFLTPLIIVIGFGVVGFLDDYIKVVLKRNLGLRAYQKLIGQLIFAFLLAYYGANYTPNGTKLLIPFVGTYFDFGIFYIPLTMFAILGIVNGVNLTDGLDGLNSGVTFVVMLAFTIITNSLMILSDISYMAMSVLSSATAGACLGFLLYNKYPAKVFMGDTGSLALGGAVSVVAVLSNLTLLVPIIGGIYVLETLSVIIQVSYYKRTKKRVFRMTPIHHHFEECGWKETKVVNMFWLVSIIFAIIGILSI